MQLYRFLEEVLGFRKERRQKNGELRRYLITDRQTGKLIAGGSDGAVATDTTHKQFNQIVHWITVNRDYCFVWPEYLIFVFDSLSLCPVCLARKSMKCFILPCLNALVEIVCLIWMSNKRTDWSKSLKIIEQLLKIDILLIGTSHQPIHRSSSSGTVYDFINVQFVHYKRQIITLIFQNCLLKIMFRFFVTHFASCVPTLIVYTSTKQRASIEQIMSC